MCLAAFLDRPVVDMTEIKGNYDFTIELSPEDFRAMQIRAAVAAGATVPLQAIQMAEPASGILLPMPWRNWDSSWNPVRRRWKFW